MAASIKRVGVDRQPTHPEPGAVLDGEARFEELHAQHEAGHVAGHGAHGVEAR